MKVCHYLDVEPAEGPPGSFKREVINAADGAPNRMLVFEVKPGVQTWSHTHADYHEVFFYSGNGVVVKGGKEIPIGEGSVVFVPPNEPHSFINKGDESLRFIYVVPLST